MEKETDHSGLSAHTRALNQYLAALDRTYRAGNATEHSYRPALKALLETLTDGLSITNEPKRQACGAPDYIVTRGPIPLGYIEAKDIPVGIHDKANQAQYDRYKEALPNLIITNYIDFELYTDGELAASASIANFDGKGVTPDKKQYAAFIALIEAFTGYQGKTLANSEVLAHIMAAKTRLLASTIAKALAASAGDDGDPIRTQLAGFRQVLIHDLGEGEFADIYAQTLAYGMFAARLNDRTSEPFTRARAASLIPLSNPFLRKFFQFIAGFDLDERIAWIVDALADIFNCVSVGDILTEFAKQGQDPYIHFYETFLAEYDPRLRESRGVYYTPIPVVRFIVRAVDDILQSEFGLPRGLADNSKIKRTITAPGGNGKKTSVEFHRVQILDPATGTGTFLAEVIDRIYAKFANQKGAWPAYCKENLIPRLNGFEILMASYAMAHFKLDMKLHETGYTGTGGGSVHGERLRVYLTNTLEEPDNSASTLQMVKWLTDEAEEAASIKRNTPVMVVLGNPPYSGESENLTRADFLAPYKKEPGGVEKLAEKNPKWLNDDYVKFIRYGQSLIETYGDGVLAFINNHSFLDNPTFRGMRWSLLDTFDTIYVLDLHGNAKKKETAPDGGKDVNVFDIQQGVSVNLFVKTGRKKAGEPARVFHRDLYGEREAKYAFLYENTLDSIAWDRLAPAAPQYFFVKKDFSGAADYERGFSVNELFPVNSVGIVTGRDDLAIQDSAKAMKAVLADFAKLPVEDARAKYKLGKDSRDWTVERAQKDLTNPGIDDTKIMRIAYRPFDTRWTYYTGNSRGFQCMARARVMGHFLSEKNYGLMVCRQIKSGMFAHCLVHSFIIESSYVSNKTSEIGYSFPLYLYPDADGLDENEERKPNLDDKIVAAIAAKTGLRFVVEKTEKDGGADTFTPLDLLDYIYAVLHSPRYRAQYAEFLKIDFPRVPYPESAEAFQRLAAFGATLRKLHLLDGVNPSQDYSAFPVAGDNIIDKAEWRRCADGTSSGSVHINKTQYFENIPEDVWEFYIGGYQPAQKWLKDRRGRSLDFDGIEHYQKIITALKLTLDIQAQIDGKTGF